MFELQVVSRASSPTQPGATACVVAVAGEIDVATSDRLRDELTGVLATGTIEIVVDASAIEFIDASGIGALCGAADAARQAGGALALWRPSRPVRRLVEILELDHQLPVAGPRASAP